LIDYGEIVIKFKETDATKQDQTIFLLLNPILDVAQKTRNLF